MVPAGHPVKFSGCDSVMANLGQAQMARELYADTFARRRQVSGEDHPDTLTSAAGLASALRSVGNEEAATELVKWAFEVRRDAARTYCNYFQ